MLRGAQTAGATTTLNSTRQRGGLFSARTQELTSKTKKSLGTPNSRQNNIKSPGCSSLNKKKSKYLHASKDEQLKKQMEERQRINAQLNIYLRNESMIKDRQLVHQQESQHHLPINSHMKANIMMNSVVSGAETERSSHKPR